MSIFTDDDVILEMLVRTGFGCHICLTGTQTPWDAIDLFVIASQARSAIGITRTVALTLAQASVSVTTQVFF